MAGPQIWLHNTLTRSKEPFNPIDPANVRMYVCGPTVYDFAHIGNARPVIVFDVLYRLLREVYGPKAVTYVRNITDVDDKINARAARDFPGLALNDAIRQVTEKTAAQFQADAKALGALEPDVQPRATDNIDGMQKLIAELISKSHAYEAEGEVLFEVSSMDDYGQLSGRKLEDQLAGARVAVDAHKRNPADFVLWKQSSAEEPGWDSPWGRGRPGWHIECSAMSERYLGQTFDIHGGGLDLIFPHHENEIAQSRCAHGSHAMANVWMHNGFVQVEGQKMSKSLGNFVTINELLATDKFGGRTWPGEVLRLAMLMTHYREPIDFSVRRLEEAEALLAKWHRVLEHWVLNPERVGGNWEPAFKAARDNYDEDGVVVGLLADDLNVPLVTTYLSGVASDHNAAVATGRDLPKDRYWDFLGTLILLGLISPESWAQQQAVSEQLDIPARISERLAALNSKDFARADAIRNELAGQGVQLMDYKDPDSGERKTKWELKR